MRLISCHIENFGKLSDYTVEFDKNQNVICEDNGWGKSTFAAFIRAMFYGFDGERKRNIEENERKRYKPWQGGVFGGKLTFESNGKRYVITRVFGEKELNDTFELRDADTNLISTDYTSNIGKELFKIDRASFVRTAFIGQNEVETASTDDINAKIGNLTDNSNDLNCYEKASAKLTELINGMTPRRATGSISKRTNEIASLERVVQSGSSIIEAINQNQEYLQAETENYEKKETERKETEKMQIEASKIGRVVERVSLYTLTDMEKQELKQLSEMFIHGIPEEQEIDRELTNVSELIELRQESALEQISKEEKERLIYLNSLFAEDEHTANDMLVKWNTRNTKKSVLPSNQAALAALEATEASKNKNQGVPVIAMLGVALVVLSVITIFAVSEILGGIGSVIGSILAIVGFVLHKKRVETQPLEETQQIIDLKKTIEEDLFYIGLVDEEIKNYLNAHQKTFDEYMALSTLQELAGEQAEFTRLQKKYMQAKNSTKANEIVEKKATIETFLEQYGVIVSENQFAIELHALKNKMHRYAVLQEKQKKYIEAETLYKNTVVADLPSLDELNQQLEGLSVELDDIRRRKQDYNRILEGLQEQYEEWEEAKLKLETEKEIQAAEREKYNSIVKAKEYLGLAKESMTSKYARPIFESFSKYFEMITKGTTEHYHIDANTAITVEEHGMQRETNALSAGYKDLIGLCLRIALVDAMYQEELPMLIMDDPFVNFDDDKVEAAKDFLQEISQKYQVIYFTCSKARK